MGINKNGFLFAIALYVEKTHTFLNPIKDLSKLRKNPEELKTAIMTILDTKLNRFSIKTIKEEISFLVGGAKLSASGARELMDKAQGYKTGNQKGLFNSFERLNLAFDENKALFEQYKATQKTPAPIQKRRAVSPYYPPSFVKQWNRVIAPKLGATRI